LKIVCALPEIRARHGRMTLTEISKRTGIAISTLSRLDSGKAQRLDYETIVPLCKLFKMQPGDFFRLEFEEGDQPFNYLAAVPAA
jgi:DNA-binding Xre family transcriptional regulator